MIRASTIAICIFLVHVAYADTLSVFLESKCSSLTREVQLLKHETNGVNKHKFCIDHNLIITGEDIDSVRQREKPSDEYIAKIEREFKSMESKMNLPGSLESGEIVFSEFEIVLSKTGASKFGDMRKSGMSLLLVHNQTLLSVMNLDRNGREGNAIILLSDSLNYESKNILKQHINNAQK